MKQTETMAETQPRWWEGVFGEPPVPGQTVALAGAGGKTTLLFTLARELAGLGYRTAATTTTHIFYPAGSQCPRVVTGPDWAGLDAALAEGFVTVGVPAENGKLSSPPPAVLSHLRAAADFLLVEADGSRCLPIKAPREGEPVLPWKPDRLAAVCGLSCLGRPLDEVCQRAELARAVLGVDGAHPVTPADAARLLYRSYGGCADRVTFVFNQADDAPLRERAVRTGRELLALGAARVVASSFFTGWIRRITA